MRLLLIVALFVALPFGAVSAANLAGIRCEDAPVVDFIKTTLKDMKVEGGESLANYLGDNSKLTATTVSSASDRLICKINLSVAFAGRTEKIRGQFIYREFASGKATAKFVPF
jgi:hypothetical protein